MSQSGSTGEVWILGATGRIGRAVAARLAGTDVSPVLVGRDPDRLAAVAASIDDRIGILVARSPEEAAAEITKLRRLSLPGGRQAPASAGQERPVMSGACPGDA
jgi:NAD(P)-dependent dehydrogenase (short-subunit alcohol dehydrogenase family)